MYIIDIHATVGLYKMILDLLDFPRTANPGYLGLIIWVLKYNTEV